LTPTVVEEPEGVAALDTVRVGAGEIIGNWGEQLSCGRLIVIITSAIASRTNLNGLNFISF
jgi:hypothetical protein